MEILVNVIGQKLKIATNLKCFISGSQQFVKFIFNMDDSWDNLTTFAQFRQNDVAYNQYLDANNSVYLPREIGAGACTLILYGTGGNVRATTNYLTLTIDENILVTNAQSTEITQSLYEQLVNSVTTSTNRLQDRVSNVENVIQGLAGGAPIVVASTSAMTDTNQIYVLTTNSKWYYYTGSEWAAGGTYGSAGTDKTLSVSGASADAKVTGDAVRNVANAVNNIDRRVDNIIGQTGDSNTEIVDARQDAVGVVHNTLRSRLLTDYRNITNSPNNTYLFAERVLQYDYPYEHTLNGFCCDDDYFYVTSVARNTIPADFQKTKILKFSRSTYELVAEIEGDYDF